jgi:hypothetical protein
MGKRYIACCMLLIIFFAFLSCTKTADGITGPAGPAGTAGTPINDVRSVITGYVNLHSEFNIPVSDLDSITVSTKMNDSLIQTITDKTGLFRLSNLKSGEYRILFQGKGYDSIGVNIKHSAGNEDQFINSIPVIASLSSHFTGQGIDLEPDVNYPTFNIATITTVFDGPPVSDLTARFLEFYFSGSPNVNMYNAVYSGEGHSSGLGINYVVSYIGFQGSDINDLHFKTGDTVYMKTYFVPLPNVRTIWFDTNSYQTISYPYTGDSLRSFFIWKN